MPELPEVTTIVFGLNKKVKNLTIKDVWTDLHVGRKTALRKQDLNTIKNPKYFNLFKKAIVEKKIIEAERVGKNILIKTSGDKTILLHMKMTGHMLYGKWNLVNESGRKVWRPQKENTPLSDPYNRFIHLMFDLSNGYQLAFSDVRKFGKVVLLEKGKELESKDLKNLGPDPLNPGFTFKEFQKALSKKKDGAIKQVLLNQEIISGIGNIYSDEILWTACIHPTTNINELSEQDLKNIFTAAKKIMTKSVGLGGDSMSDFRNIEGERGGYQKCHLVYGQLGKTCNKKGCCGVIHRIKVAGRSAHFCETHQRKNK